MLNLFIICKCYQLFKMVIYSAMERSIFNVFDANQSNLALASLVSARTRGLLFLALLPTAAFIGSSRNQGHMAEFVIRIAI